MRCDLLSRNDMVVAQLKLKLLQVLVLDQLFT